jgi:hypothetical protein
MGLTWAHSVLLSSLSTHRAQTGSLQSWSTPARALSADAGHGRYLNVRLTARHAPGDIPVRPSDGEGTPVSGRAALGGLLWRFWPCAGRPDHDSPVVKPFLARGFIGEGDMITRLEASQSVSHDHREMNPASSRGVGGVDHPPAMVIAPLSDSSLAWHTLSMFRVLSPVRWAGALGGTRTPTF